MCSTVLIRTMQRELLQRRRRVRHMGNDEINVSNPSSPSTSKTARLCLHGEVPTALFSLTTLALVRKIGRSHLISHRTKSIQWTPLTTISITAMSDSLVVHYCSTMADDISSNGTGSSILDINNFG